MSFEKEVFLEFKEVYFKHQVPEFSGLIQLINRSKTIAVFPITHEKRYWDYIYQTIMLFLIIFLVLAEIGGIFTVLDDLVECAVAFLETVTLAMIGFKLQHFQRHWEELVNIGKEIERRFASGVLCVTNVELKERLRHDFIEYYIIVPLLGYFFLFNLILTVVIMPAFITEKILFVAVYPWDPYKSSLVFYLTYALQGFTYSFAMFQMSLIEAFGIGSLHYTNMLFVLLADKMTRLGKTKQELKELIQSYQELVAIADRINAVYLPLFIGQICVSLTLNCLSGFEMVLALTRGNIPVFQRFFSLWFTVFSQIAFWCYNGNKVYWTSQEMPLALMQCDWYDMPLEIQKGLILVFQRIQQAVEFRAGILCAYNLETLIWIMNKSYSYFTILMNIMKETG